MRTQRGGLIEYFGCITDPRMKRKRRHELVPILAISVLAVLCGAQGFTDIADFGLAKQYWLQTFLSLPNGIPSHDTFARVFALLDMEKFQAAFLEWTKAVSQLSEGRLIAIDGKTLRHSFDTAAEKAAIHLVSAWGKQNGIFLGQLQVDAKSNEITAIPKLLELINLKGAIVSIDAMGTQTEIASDIVDKGGDYVLALKGNQETTFAEVKQMFDNPTTQVEQVITTDKGHGRIEERTYRVITDLSSMQTRGRWKNLMAVASVACTVWKNSVSSTETRYFLASVKDATQLADAIRGHWSIENTLHWCLDVTLGEDQCRIRNKQAPANFALLRKFAISRLKQDTVSLHAQKSIRRKQKISGWDHQYLLNNFLGVFNA
jgi:predicted transposase YbfD/YdcC